MRPELTMFTTTRPFEGVHAVHQENSLRSWTALVPRPQVIVIGDDPGARDAAAALDVDFDPEVRRSPSGLPFLSDLFARAQQRAAAPVSCYANADIILPPDFGFAVTVAKEHLTDFLLIGQRWDVVQDEPLDLRIPNNWYGLRDRARRGGELRGPYWVDYFAFPTGMYHDLPDLILGRPGWDNWLVWHTRDRGIPVVDATEYLTVLHHDHGRGHGPGRTRVTPGSDADWNRNIIASEAHMFTVGHATHRLTTAGDVVPATGVKYAASALLNRIHPILRLTRPARHRLGLEADAVQRIATRLRR